MIRYSIFTLILLMNCNAWYPEVPCIKGKPGRFIGKMIIIHDNCKDLLPRTDFSIKIEIEKNSWLTECGTHLIGLEDNGLYINGHWCDELMDTTLEPAPQGYVGFIYYELYCGEYFSCRAKIKVDFQKVNAEL